MKLTQYLQLHGGKYRVRMVVPPHLRDVVGKAVLLHPLNTADLRQAAEWKWPLVSEFKALLAKAERALGTEDPITKEAMITRVLIQRGDEVYDTGEDGTVIREDWGQGGEKEVEKRRPVNDRYIIVNDEADWAEERAQEIEREKGPKAAQRFARIAFGRETPLTEHVDQSCAALNYKETTRGELLRVLGWLDSWLVGAGKTNSLEAVDRKTAGEFLRGKLHQDRSAKRVKVYLSGLRSYWEWMIEAGYLSGESPWAGHKVRVSNREEQFKEPPRPFTDDEIAALLSVDAPDDMGFVLRVAALSGMRISEIMGLTLAECEGGMFRILAGKTVNARRVFPIHADLQAEIEGRIAAYRPSDPLSWSGAEHPADAMGKAFIRFRRKLGIGAERRTARDKSEVNFHSFRRWFVDQVRDAKRRGEKGFDEATLASVVGHVDDGKLSTMEALQRLYEGQAKPKAQRALLATVKLPDGIPPLIPFVRPPRRRTS
jgi:integrase